MPASQEEICVRRDVFKAQRRSKELAQDLNVIHETYQIRRSRNFTKQLV
jgi:hypothetical protein